MNIIENEKARDIGGESGIVMFFFSFIIQRIKETRGFFEKGGGKKTKFIILKEKKNPFRTC